MLLRRVHVLMPQYRRDQIDVPGLAVKARAISAAELVRRDLLHRRRERRVLLHELFDGADAYALFLH